MYVCLVLVHVCVSCVCALVCMCVYCVSSELVGVSRSSIYRSTLFVCVECLALAHHGGSCFCREVMCSQSGLIQTSLHLCEDEGVTLG